MSCFACLRSHDAKKLPFLCPVDARNTIYSDRIKNLQLLVENEGLRSQINTLIDGSEVVDAGASAQTLADHSAQQILESANKVRRDIRDAKEEIKQKRAAISARRSRLVAASQGISDRRLKDERDIEKSTQVFNFRWSQSAEDMASTRAFLCREAAKLYGLKRTRKGNSGRYDYFLGKLPVVDLSNMECKSPAMYVVASSLHPLINIQHKHQKQFPHRWPI